jgi:hypothetical protein
VLARAVVRLHRLVEASMQYRFAGLVLAIAVAGRGDARAQGELSITSAGRCTCQ